MVTKNGRFAVEVIADSSEVWCGNGLRFPFYDAAEAYAKDLWSRWTSVRSWRVVEYAAAGWGYIKVVAQPKAS